MLAALSITVVLFSLPAHAQNDLPEPFADPSRLVSIGGSLTEIVYALGEQDKLVARDSTSVFPREALELPDIGYMRQLAPEGVLSVAPTAILALEGSGPPETMNVLTRGSVPLLLVPDRFDRDGIIEKIRVVGAALAAEEKAEALAEKIAGEIDAAEALTKGIAERKRVLFVLSTQGGRILASGTGTAADGIIRMAGGVNAVGVFPGYKQVSEEAIIEAQPDVILVMNRGGGLDSGDAELLANAAIASTPAGRNRAVVRMDGSYLLGFGPRTAGAVRDLAAALYGASIAN
ncbi:ABC transporter substrate-binding protein [Chelativorans sp. AA-79]|uniref:heme/hemin ABC transporter substrate-binding protein n=1 Tax=Chelativorans sp. AA-79 TaxID=3028735 RepID=UPI0023F63408|nr:ABC transporter substrate-binding protein [Chelativorans sp. AA-79]WEX11878.1 ABC transporter substrate-binding protein [Chelativorans sp. AA-79]